MEINKDFLKFLGRCIKKDKYAWDTFVETYGNPIYQYIARTLKRYNYSYNDEGDEIFNNIFLALLDEDCKRLKIFRGKNENSFRAYLREISFHITVDFLRKKRNFIDLEQVQYFIHSKDNHDTLECKDLEEILLMLRKELPQRHNYLFKLIYEEELDFSEIAGILNIKLNALHQLKFRMIKNIIKISKKKGLYHELKKFVKDLCGIGISEPDAISVN